MKSSNPILHIVPDWPSKSQTFTLEDVKLSENYFETTHVLALWRDGSKMKLRLRFLFQRIPTMLYIQLLVIYILNSKTFRDVLKILFIGLAALTFVNEFSKTNNTKLVIHVHFFHTTLDLGILIKSLLPSSSLLVTCHGADLLLKKPSRINNVRYSSCDYIICASEAVKTKALELRNSETQIRPSGWHNFEPEVRYCRISSIYLEEAAKRKLKEIYDPFRIVTVGRIHPQKGWDVVVEIAEILTNSSFDYEWICIGEGSDLKKLSDYSKDNRLNLNFVGFKSPFQVRDYLRESDLFILPCQSSSTFTDGLPVAIFEAMSQKVPVMSTDVGGIKEALQDGRGFVLENSPEVFADMIVKYKVVFTFEEKEAMKQEAQTWVRNNMNYELDPLVKIYSKLSTS